MMNGMTKYIWQQSGWPHMVWRDERFCGLLAEVNLLRGKLLGRVSMFGFEEQNLSMLDFLTQEIVHSAKIEGEDLNRDSVRSSVAMHLGLQYEGLPTPDHYTEGVVQVMMDAVLHHSASVDAERLFSWHGALFPTGRSGLYKITVAAWRQGEEAMQVVSGPLGHQKVHYEAPETQAVPQMMEQLLKWINTEENIDPLVKAAVVHLWFVTIHPFDDGNGRICRTLTELLLSRADQTSQRYYSLSSEILNHRQAYYMHLEEAQKGSLDITLWIEWFLQTLKSAIEVALQKTENVVRKVHFWREHQTVSFNSRQRKVVNMLLDGFEGKLNSSKWYKINHCSQDTANRDIKDLIEKGILRQTDEGGRSTNYELILPILMV